MNDRLPDEQLAASIVASSLSVSPLACRRFTTGSHHFVYEATFSDRPPVVVRIARPSERAAMVGAAELSALLRPRGVPLPEMIAKNLDGEFPWLILERLPGTDIAAVMRDLSDNALSGIAAAVARAQSITAETDSAGRFGYAARPQNAPHPAWRDVLHANVERSRHRIAKAGLFDRNLPDELDKTIEAFQIELDVVRATPFLHDAQTKNVIVTSSGAFSGIVDVDDLCFGDPRYAAALTLAVILAYGGPQHYVAALLRHAGQADDRVFRLYVAVLLLDLMSEHGHDFNGNQGPTEPDVREHLLRVLRSTLDKVRA
ncbi:MAG TPA: aminoglycoside phosphotransferase family protein [Rhizomicrobium sp.]|nr:aminoglycoside phosphotransferase family protein [Rhizomicrobium sp.]